MYYAIVIYELENKNEVNKLHIIRIYIANFRYSFCFWDTLISYGRLIS
jgi:hypothetical protein